MSDELKVGDYCTSSEFKGFILYIRNFGTSWCEYEEDFIENPDWCEVTMVGDDESHFVETYTLVKIDEDEHVCSCGQIGCMWD